MGRVTRAPALGSHPEERPIVRELYREVDEEPTLGAAWRANLARAGEVFEVENAANAAAAAAATAAATDRDAQEEAALNQAMTSGEIAAPLQRYHVDRFDVADTFIRDIRNGETVVP